MSHIKEKNLTNSLPVITFQFRIVENVLSSTVSVTIYLKNLSVEIGGDMNKCDFFG